MMQVCKTECSTIHMCTSQNPVLDILLNSLLFEVSGSMFYLLDFWDEQCIQIVRLQIVSPFGSKREIPPKPPGYVCNTPKCALFLALLYKRGTHGKQCPLTYVPMATQQNNVQPLFRYQEGLPTKSRTRNWETDSNHVQDPANLKRNICGWSWPWIRYACLKLGDEMDRGTNNTAK